MRIRAAVAVCLGTILLFAIAAPAAAQTKVSSGVLVGAGVSFLIDEQTATGFSVSVVKDLRRQGKIAVGVAGDVGFHKLTQNIETVEASASITSFVVGPRITSAANETFSPFAQFLVGAVRAHISAEIAGEDLGSVSGSGFGFAVGGGLNMKVHERVNFLVQVDLMHSSIEVEGENATGNVTRFLVGVSTRIGG